MSVAHYVTLPFKWQFKVFLTSFWQFRTRFWQFSDGLAFRLNWPIQMYARTVNMELYTFNCSCISIGQLKWNFQWGEKTPTTFWNAHIHPSLLRNKMHFWVIQIYDLFCFVTPAERKGLLTSMTLNCWRQYWMALVSWRMTTHLTEGIAQNTDSAYWHHFIL